MGTSGGGGRAAAAVAKYGIIAGLIVAGGFGVYYLGKKIWESLKGTPYEQLGKGAEAVHEAVTDRIGKDLQGLGRTINAVGEAVDWLWVIIEWAIAWPFRLPGLIEKGPGTDVVWVDFNPDVRPPKFSWMNFDGHPPVVVSWVYWPKLNAEEGPAKGIPVQGLQMCTPDGAALIYSRNKTIHGNKEWSVSDRPDPAPDRFRADVAGLMDYLQPKQSWSDFQNTFLGKRYAWGWVESYFAILGRQRVEAGDYPRWFTELPDAFACGVILPKDDDDGPASSKPLVFWVAMPPTGTSKFKFTITNAEQAVADGFLATELWRPGDPAKPPTWSIS